MGSGGARQARQSCRDRGERAVAHVTAERPSPLRLPGPLLPSRLRPPAPSGAGGRARQRRRRRPRATRGRPRQVRRGQQGDGRGKSAAVRIPTWDRANPKGAGGPGQPKARRKPARPASEAAVRRVAESPSRHDRRVRTGRPRGFRYLRLLPQPARPACEGPEGGPVRRALPHPQD